MYEKQTDIAKSKRDYYEVLGIDKTAGDTTIKKVCRVLAKRYHPDINPGGMEVEKKFKEVSEAYTVLGDPEKRWQHDRFGHVAFDGDAGGGGYGGLGGFDSSGTDMGDIFGGIFSDTSGSGGSSRDARYNGPACGANVRTGIRISFEEAILGCKEEIEINYKDECTPCHRTGAKTRTKPKTYPKCNDKDKIMYAQQSMFSQVQNMQTCPDYGGSGQIIREKCPDCRGMGYITRQKKLKVTISAGIDDGQSIRMAGTGEPGISGDERGDLLVEAVISRHPVFTRKDMNIYSTILTSFTIAAPGGPIRVNTVDGQVKYEVRFGTRTDVRVCLKGKGVPSLRNKAVRGDHYVTLVVWVSERMNEEQRETLRRFDEVMTGKITRSGEDEGEESRNHKRKGFFK